MVLPQDPSTDPTCALLGRGLPFHSRDTTLPRLYATGTNDCQRRNNSDTMAALLPAKLGMRSGFSWHSYPGPSSTTTLGEIAELPIRLEWGHSAC